MNRTSGIRDVDTTFGLISIDTAAKAVEFPRGIDMGEGGELGHMDSVNITVVVQTKAVPASDVITITLKQAKDKGTATEIQALTQTGTALKPGDSFQMAFPKTNLRYLSLEGTVKTTTGVGLFAYLTRG